jgi:hypothetical protein
VSSYWIKLREQESTGNWKRKPYIALYGDFALEGATSQYYMMMMMVVVVVE